MKKNSIITTRIEGDVKRELKRRAENNGLKTSKFIRIILTKAVNEKKKLVLED